MRGPVRPVALVVVLLAASVAGSAPAAAAPASPATTADLAVDVTISRTDDPRTVRLVYEYRIPAPVDAVYFDVPTARADAVTVVNTTGLVAQPDGRSRFRADGRRASLTATLTLTSVENATRGYLGDDTAFLTLPRFVAAWSGVDTLRTVPNATVRGRGAASFPLAYLGNYTAATGDTGRQTVRVVVPDNRAGDVDPSAPVDTLVGASEYVPDDDPARSVTGFVLPAGMATEPSGVAHSRHAFWVLHADPSVWVHEYVHTRQDAFAPGMYWLVEGSAEYYAQLYVTNDGTWSFAELRDSLAVTASGSSALANQSTWTSDQVPYRRGARVLVALDARIRNATNGTATFSDLYRDLEAQEAPVSVADFERATARYLGDERAARFVDRYVTGTAAVELPSAPRYYTLGPDSDRDGLPVDRERDLGSLPVDPDTDDDALPDGREVALGTNPAAADSDDDGASDGREVTKGLDPTAADTDGDGASDGRELARGLDPLGVDTDGDALSDGRELALGASPTQSDSDGDGVRDGREASLGANVTAAHSDADLLPDGHEVHTSNTDPAAADTDGDGTDDGSDAFPRDPGRSHRPPVLAAMAGGMLLAGASFLGVVLVAGARAVHRVLGVASTGVADRVVPRVLRARSLRRLVLLGALGVAVIVASALSTNAQFLF